MASRKLKLGMKIRTGGDTWEIVGLGVEREGETFAHLASTTRGRQQQNGWTPIQSGRFIKGTK